MPFWEDNRSDGTPDGSILELSGELFPRVTIALTVGQSAALVALP